MFSTEELHYTISYHLKSTYISFSRKLCNNESIEENFRELIQIYSLLTRIDPAKSQQAKQIVQRKINKNLVTPEKREGFTVPCSYSQTREFSVKYLAFDNGWEEYKLWQIANDINYNGDLTRDWKKSEIEKIRESSYENALEKIVGQFEHTTEIILGSETQDKIRQFIEKNSRVEHFVVTKKIKRRGTSKSCVVIECCIFYEMSIATVAKIASIDLFDVTISVAVESI